MAEHEGLTQLGRPARPAASPAEAVLDRVPNPHPDTHYAARFAAPEFTTLCPVTGQPDFAHLVIDYVPDGWLVELKSLKLYLASFRNHGAFHEECTVASASASRGCSSRTTCASAATGIRAAACRSTSSGRRARARGTYGCPTRAWRPIVGAGGGRAGGGDRRSASPRRGLVRELRDRICAAFEALEDAQAAGPFAGCPPAASSARDPPRRDGGGGRRRRGHGGDARGPRLREGRRQRLDRARRARPAAQRA